MRPEAFRPPVTLSGRYVELVPLSVAHAEALWGPASRPEVTQYLRVGPVPSKSAMEEQIRTLLALQDAGTDLPFTTCLLPDRRPIGMTRFLRIDRPNDTVEIGGTWIEPLFWRTPVNTEAKLLMLRHAFEVERAWRVQLQTDSRNERSQRAIARIGAVREGTLREDVLLPNGYRRSSVYFSILRTEWPTVESRLTLALGRAWAPPADSPAR
jgi:N-acetyltransferase